MKTDKPPAMPFYGKQFYDDESVWLSTLAHQGLYVALLWNQWQQNSIPSDVKLIARLVGQPERAVRPLWEEVSQHFSPLDGQPGRLANAALERIRTEVTELRQKRASAGLKGNSLRWQSESQDTSQNDRILIANGVAKVSPPNGDGDGVKESPNFEEAWNYYPRKIGKAAAERHFRAQVKTRADYGALLSAIANYRNELGILGTEDRFVKHGSSFFNGVWRDYVDGVWKPPTGRSPKPSATFTPIRKAE